MRSDTEDSYITTFRSMLGRKTPVTLPRTLAPFIPSRSEESAYPMLVTFADLADPTSVEEVDPDDLAATFGEGVRLKRITVQLTDDPVTTGIEQRLGWLEHVYQMGLKTEDFPENFPVGDFKGLFRKGYE